MRPSVLLVSAALLSFMQRTASTPSSPEFRVSAVQQWRIEGQSTTSPFADVADFIVGVDSVLWVLDRKDNVVTRVDHAGRVLNAVGRTGSGPGESRNANGLLLRPDGAVWLNDIGNARISMYDASGRFRRSVAIVRRGALPVWNAWIDQRTGETIEPVPSLQPGLANVRWQRLSGTARVLGALRTPRCDVGTPSPLPTIHAFTMNVGGRYQQYPFRDGGGLAPADKGRSWCAAPGSRRVALIDNVTNDTILETTIDVPTQRIPAAERDSAIDAIERANARYASTNFDRALVPVTRSGIARLDRDADGRLWVQHAAGTAPITIFDVHDQRGRPIARVALPGRAASRDLPIRVRGQLIWFAVRDEDDVVGITQYRIPWLPLERV